MAYHDPALLQQAVDGLDIKPGGVYVDATFGGGGHSREILRRLGKDGKLFAFDQDEDVLKNLIEDDRCQFIQHNFRYLKRFLKLYGVKEADGVLADFGLSSHQIDEAGRGFSTRFDGPLDMRMDRKNPLSAVEVLNGYSKARLRTVLSDYGEVRPAAGMAAAIAAHRKEAPIGTGAQLKEAIRRFLPRGKENKMLARVYQAIRIEVNDELGAIRDFLQQSVAILGRGGRLCAISYHSLEDRLVKRFIRNGQFEGEPERDVFGRVEVPFKKIGKLVVPSEEEIRQNPRARSARLRIAEKT